MSESLPPKHPNTLRRALERAESLKLKAKSTLGRCSINSAQQERLYPKEEVKLVVSEAFESPTGGEVWVVKALPKHENSDSTPIFFAGGYGVDAGPYIASFAESGTTAYTLNHTPTKGSDTRFIVGGQNLPSASVSARHAERLLTDSDIDLIVSEHQSQKAATLLHAMELEGVKQANLIFQSESALQGLLAAYAAPEKFGSIVLTYPAGIVRQDRVHRAYRNVIKEVISKSRPRRRTTAENSLVERESFFKQWAKKRQQKEAQGSFFDVATAAISDQAALLYEMRQEDNAPGVTLVAGLEDRIYSVEGMLRNLRSSEDVDFILVTEGLHGINGRRDVIDQITSLFPKMESLKAQRREAQEKGEEFKLPPLRDRLMLPSTISNARREQLYNLADQLDVRTENNQSPQETLFK